MLRLIENGKNKWYNIVDDCGCQVSATKEELNGLYQQLVRVKGGLQQEKENTSIVILENDMNGEKVQMELSDSAYRLLYYLIEEDWFDSDIHITEVDETNFERFI